MNFKTNDVIHEIQHKLRLNQFLMFLCLVLTLGVITFLREHLYLAVSFVLLASLSLPNINKCKGDIDKLMKNEPLVLKGKVVDYFPEASNDKSKRWILFLLGEDKKIKEIFFKTDVKLSEDDAVEIKVTPSLKIPIEILKDTIDKQQ